MRTVPATLATRLATGSSNTCFIVTITPVHAPVVRMTEADTDLSVGGNTYVSTPGLLLGSIPYALDGFSSGVDIEFGTTDDTPVSRADIRDGAYDAAEVQVSEVDFTIPGAGAVDVFWGRVGDVSRTVEGKTKFECKGVLSLTYQIFVERYTPMCIWYFCDDRCGLNPATYTHTATITAIPDSYTLTISGAAAGVADDVLKDGVMEVTSGDRDGLKVEVRGNSGSTLQTFLAHPVGLQVGDTLSILQGCQKRFVDCQAYGNYKRFGGQPYAGTSEEAQAITYVEWGGG